MPEQQRLRWASLVRPARLARGLTQAELADAAGVSTRTVGNVEAGRGVPHMGVLERLDAVLGFLPDEDPAAYPVEIRSWVSAVCPLLMRMAPDVRARVMQQALVYAGHALADSAVVDLAVSAADSVGLGDT